MHASVCGVIVEIPPFRCPGPNQEIGTPLGGQGAISLLSPEYLLSFERRPYHMEPPDHFALLSHLIDLYVSQSSPLVPMHSTRGYHSR